MGILKTHFDKRTFGPTKRLLSEKRRAQIARQASEGAEGLACAGDAPGGSTGPRTCGGGCGAGGSGGVIEAPWARKPEFLRVRLSGVRVFGVEAAADALRG